MPARLTAPTHFHALDARHTAAIAALFWLFTYALLSWRTELLLGDAFPLLSVRRLLGTSAGAAIYWLVLHWIERSAKHGTSARPIAIVATILPASIAVLAARLAVDRLFYESALPFTTNLRWVLAWSGYFGMWVSISLALQLHRGARARAWAPPALKVRTAALASQAICAPATARADGEAWVWLVDAAARELAGRPEVERLALIERLVADAGCHIADGLDDGRQNARVDLVWRIAARSAEDGSHRSD